MKRWLLGALTLAAPLILLVVLAPADFVAWAQGEPRAATTRAAEPGPVGVGALGRVEPASRIRRIGPPGGQGATRLDRLFVTEGEEVREGQLLAAFADAPTRDAALARAEAALAEAEAELARVRAAGRESEIAAQRARIERLRAQAEFAAREAERAERLLPTGAGAVAAADRARAAASAAAAELAEAEAQLVTLSAPRAEDVAVAEARVASARAARDAARAEAALSRVVAPFAGTVLAIHVRPGQQVGNDGVLDLADLSAMEVVAEVYETDLPRVRLGAVAEVVVPGEPRRLSARVTQIGWQVRRSLQATTDPVAAVDARTVEVRLALDEEGAALVRRRSNMQVQVAIRP
ncbi:MAG: efflux RND transporter periplasmic adaptor subunit [Acetobacteraceae bacterium]